MPENIYDNESPCLAYQVHFSSDHVHVRDSTVKVHPAENMTVLTFSC